MPSGRQVFGVVAHNGYVYVIGGASEANGGGVLSSVVYAKIDPNDTFTNPLTITMDSDKESTTSFKCGIGVGPMLPMIAVALLGIYFLRRRRT